MPAQVDLPRLKDGKVGGAFWSAFVLCPKNGTDFTDGNYAEGRSSICYAYSLPVCCLRAHLPYATTESLWHKENAYSR